MTRRLRLRRQTAIERDKAVAAEAKTKTINEFLINDLLTQAEPENNAVEDNVTLLEVLDRAAEKVGKRFAVQPELESAPPQNDREDYHSLASWDKAETQHGSCSNAARKRDPRRPSPTKLKGFAHILRHRGRRDAEVMKMAEEAARGTRAHLGLDHPDTLTMLNNLACAYKDVGKLPEAIALFERVRDAHDRQAGSSLPTTTSTWR